MTIQHDADGRYSVAVEGEAPVRRSKSRPLSLPHLAEAAIPPTILQDQEPNPQEQK
jgi:hypothetical protein